MSLPPKKQGRIKNTGETPEGRSATFKVRFLGGDFLIFFSIFSASIAARFARRWSQCVLGTMARGICVLPVVTRAAWLYQI